MGQVKSVGSSSAEVRNIPIILLIKEQRFHLPYAIVFHMNDLLSNSFAIQHQHLVPYTDHYNFPFTVKQDITVRGLEVVKQCDKVSNSRTGRISLSMIRHLELFSPIP